MHSQVSKDFITAGNSTFTIETPAGTHYTYKVCQSEPSVAYPQPAWFVKLLSGPDNESDYTYLGKLSDFTGQVSATVKSPAYCRSQKKTDDNPFHLLNRVLARVWAGDHAAFEAHGYKLHHEGRCGRCGRKLTTPESCERGIGPECWSMMGGERLAPVAKQEPQPLPAVPAPARVATPVRPAKQEISLDAALKYAATMAAGCKAGIGLVESTKLAEAGLAALQATTQPRRESATSVFASDLNLKAGQWPEALVQDGVTYAKGNLVYDREGELTLIQYVGPGLLTLTVFND